MGLLFRLVWIMIYFYLFSGILPQFLPLVLTADLPPNFSSYFVTMAQILPLNLRQGPSPPPPRLLNVEIPHWDYYIAQIYSYRLGFGIEILIDQAVTSCSTHKIDQQETDG